MRNTEKIIKQSIYLSEIYDYKIDNNKLKNILNNENIKHNEIKDFIEKSNIDLSNDLVKIVEYLNELIDFNIKFFSKKDMDKNIKYLYKEYNYIFSNIEPFPFQEFLAPLVIIFKQKLIKKFSAEILFFSEKSLNKMYNFLLKKLVSISEKTLYSEFVVFRKLYIESKDYNFNENSKDIYNLFLKSILYDGAFNFFEKYPVLARLIITISEFWLNNISDFINRISIDLSEISFIFNENVFNKITNLNFSLSDPHNKGKNVILLEFDNSFKIIYKPRNLEIELDFQNFISFYNNKTNNLKLKVIKIINKKDYGWIEYIEHKSCNNNYEAINYYNRIGMLLCILYAFNTTDCHDENLIANGENPILIDLETLFQPDKSINSFYNKKNIHQEYWNSVLRTGMLPIWEKTGSVFFDISALGSYFFKQNVIDIEWININKNGMNIKFKTIAFSNLKKNNVPILNKKKLLPSKYIQDIKTGFENMYIFFIDIFKNKKQELRNFFINKEIRVVLKNTAIYYKTIANSINPENLKSGIYRSIEINKINIKENTENKIFKSELISMENMDVPYFTTFTNSKTIFTNKNKLLDKYLKCNDIFTNIKFFNENNLKIQMKIIKDSFYIESNRIKKSNIYINSKNISKNITNDDLINKTILIGNKIKNECLISEDKSINWLNYEYLDENKKDLIRIMTMNDSLYNGKVGISLFLSALYHITKNDEYKNLALKSIISIKNIINSNKEDYKKNISLQMTIGGLSGLGSLVYVFSKMSYFLNEKSLLLDAKKISDLITFDRILNDNQFDIVNGCAGTILSLLSLYSFTGDLDIIEKAIFCGNHLINSRKKYKNFPKAWININKKIPLTGFSHGASGISYSLIKLFEKTKNISFLNVAIEGINYEKEVFSIKNLNWPDFRIDNEINFIESWCHGAPGIGLSRLMEIETLKNYYDTDYDIKVSIELTNNHNINTFDNLCCGNFGRIDFLLTASLLEPYKNLKSKIFEKLTLIEKRKEKLGFYQIRPTENICFFHGLSGIGYQLLRIVNPIEIPSVLLLE